MAEIRRYLVTYVDGLDGEETTHTVKVDAFDAKDAEYQAMMEPKRQVARNSAYAYCYPVKVEPDRDTRVGTPAP